MSKSKPCVLIFSRTYTHVANYKERNTCLQHQTPGTICPNDFRCDWISLHGRWPVCPIVPAADLVSNEDPVTMYRLWSSMGCRFLALTFQPNLHHSPVALLSLASSSTFPDTVFWIRLWSGYDPNFLKTVNLRRAASVIIMMLIYAPGQQQPL